MIYDQDLREKMEISAKLLLSHSMIIFNMIKFLLKTFTIKLFARINEFKNAKLFFCVIFIIKNMIRYF